MLSVGELQARTYEERMEDVLRELPIRSSEWTNYNPSDPGITILENMTAFSALQGAEIVNLSYRARMALLKMAGFVPHRGKCAKVLLSGDHLSSPVTLRTGDRFHLGDLTFETNREIRTGALHLTGVFAREYDSYRDVSFVLDREISVPARIFGDEPKKGNSVYFIFDGDPQSVTDAIFYIKAVESSDRNSTVDRTEHIFADLEWECFTEAGFKKLSVRDFTSAFVNSGELRMTLPEEKLERCQEAPIEGYCIRATLTRAEYDIIPKITNVYGFLFEVWQKNTRAFSQCYNKNDRITVNSPIGNDVYYLVFGKEKKGSSYRRYELTTSYGQKGRFCLYEKNPDGSVSFTFNEEEFGFAPAKSKECVRVILYSEDVMRRYNVGKVIGFDDQEIEIPNRNIVHETFFLIARRQDEEGYTYDFVRPEKKAEGALYYHLLEGEGRIIIEDPGDFIDADLFMGSVAVTDGSRGNISSGNILSADRKGIPDGFYNPGAGIGGCFRETLDQVKERFITDMRTPYRAITARDYEYLVKTTPGLCIRKAKAVMDENKNMVKIAVLPGSEERFPKLSAIYSDKIEERLKERRLITSQFKIVRPSFVAIGVKCTVYVKRHFTDCRKQIEDRIRAKVDYIGSDHNFGDRLMFEDVFHAIEELPCVEYVYDLSLHSENNKLAQMKEYDIYPRFDCLCYPGEIDLELVTTEK
jgi:hypothetical protein